MALELVLASKAVVAAVLAPEQGAWELLLVRTGAVLLVVASEVSKLPGGDSTFLLETRKLSVLNVVAGLMIKEVVLVDRFIQATGKTAQASFTAIPKLSPTQLNLKTANTSATVV